MSTIQTPPGAPPNGSRRRATSMRSDVTDDALDELAAMFLTDDDEAAGEPADEPAALERATVELVIPGHLPVRGNLWLTPFADAVAREAGSTTLLRVDASDEFSIQILRGTSRQRDDEAGSLGDLLARLGSTTRAWIVRPPSPLDVKDVVASGVDGITILSSADDVAVVAAYRLIKELAAEAAESGVSLPRLSIAVVGTDEAGAQAMIGRVNQTAASFLDTDVSLRLLLPRIDASVQCTQHLSFSGEACPRMPDLIEMINAAGRLSQDAAPPLRLSPVSEPVASAGYEEELPRQRPRPKRTVKLSPKPFMELESREPAKSVEPADGPQPQGLASHVSGLVALRPRCPGREHVEIAVDGSGTLHLLAREQCMRDLRVVQAWVKSHRELLSMACPEHRIDPAAAAICHVFTGTPRSLADLHETELRLHVLAQVNVAGRIGWYSAPLN